MKNSNKAIAALLLCSVMLTGCGALKRNKSLETSPESEVPVSERTVGPEFVVTAFPYTEPADVAWQYQVIYDNSAIWQYDEAVDVNFNRFLYGVMDLDNDGYLEIIKSGCYDSVYQTTTKIFEVTPEGTLTEIDTSLFNNDINAAPDLWDLDEWYFFVDENGNLNYLVINIINREAAGIAYTYSIMSIQDNQIIYRPVCERVEDYGRYIYYDANDNEITKEEFDAIYASDYADIIEYKMSMTWFNEVELYRIEESYNGFRF